MNQKHIVILVHGIRDDALWHSEIRATLEASGFAVEPTNYGRVNLLQFLLPIGLFRQRAIEQLRKQLRMVRHNNQAASISVVAHSFGTYVIANILKDDFELKLNRVIFCGSVLPYNFQFEQIQERFAFPILNDVGTRDIWPALAEALTTGYGSAGTFGFRRPLIRDRWHNGARHGYFLTGDFCKKYWVPFLGEGRVEKADEAPEPPAVWLRILSIFKPKYFVLALSLFLVAIAARSIAQHMGFFDPQIAAVEADANHGLFCRDDAMKSVPVIPYHDYVTFGLHQCPNGESATRTFVVSYPAEMPKDAKFEARKGFGHCFVSDLNEKAPKVVAAIDGFAKTHTDKLRCEVSASVTRVIGVEFVDQNDQSRTLAFAQTFRPGDGLSISQISTENMATPEGRESLQLSGDGTFEDEKLFEQVRMFKIPGVPIE